MDHLFYFAFFMFSCVLSSSKLLFFEGQGRLGFRFAQKVFRLLPSPQTRSATLIPKSNPTGCQETLLFLKSTSHIQIALEGQENVFSSSQNPFAFILVLNHRGRMCTWCWVSLGRFLGWEGFFSLSMNTCRHKSVSSPHQFFFHSILALGIKLSEVIIVKVLSCVPKALLEIQ